MARESIIGSGFKGAAFEQKGMEERNLQTLLKSLSNKETQKSIEALSKIERDEWTAMAITATTLNNFLSLGGPSELINSITSSIETTIKLQIDSLLSPINNEINTAINEILGPFINNVLTPAVNTLTNFLGNNMEGAAIGGIVGAIASLVLPGGPIWIAIGAAVGAAIQDPAYLGDDRLDFFDPHKPSGPEFIPGVPIGGGALPAPIGEEGRLGRLSEFEDF